MVEMIDVERKRAREGERISVAVRESMCMIVHECVAST